MPTITHEVTIPNDDISGAFIAAMNSVAIHDTEDGTTVDLSSVQWPEPVQQIPELHRWLTSQPTKSQYDMDLLAFVLVLLTHVAATVQRDQA